MKQLNESVLEQKLKTLSLPGMGTQVETIKKYLHEASDYELAEIDALSFARKKGISGIPTLKTMLHMTKSGIFDLNWAVSCPHCKGPSAETTDLSKVRHEAHCSMCAADYDAGFDQNVSLHFSVNPSVAKLEDVDPFLVRLNSFERESGISMGIESGDEHRIEVTLQPGNYVLFNASQRKVIVMPVSSTAEAQGPNSATLVGSRQGATVRGELQELVWDYGPDTIPFRSVGFKEGKLTIRIKNGTNDTEEFLFARVKNPPKTNAALVSTLQEFRDMFSEDLLSPDEAFSVRNLSLIFTDIKSSTEMYEKLGDAKAFYLVKEHFKIMEDVVREHNGAIVKTIGDAVMAVFMVPADAIGAAADMIDRFDTFNKAQGTREHIIIKVGAHVGSCIAVTLNERIDYFGTSVNTAARIQGLSDGRNIMVSERFFDESEAQAVLGKRGWKWESFKTSLKGLKDDHKVYKLVKSE